MWLFNTFPDWNPDFIIWQNQHSSNLKATSVRWIQLQLHVLWSPSGEVCVCSFEHASCMQEQGWWSSYMARSNSNRSVTQGVTHHKYHECFSWFFDFYGAVLMSALPLFLGLKSLRKVRVQCKILLHFHSKSSPFPLIISLKCGGLAMKTNQSWCRWSHNYSGWGRVHLWLSGISPNVVCVSFIKALIVDPAPLFPRHLSVI